MQQPARINHRVYRACRDMMSERATLVLEAALDRVADLLKADSVSAGDEDSAEAIRKSLVALRVSRTHLHAGFHRELLSRLDFATPCTLRAKLGAASKGLSLQSDEVIDEYVAASSLAHLIDSECLDQMMPMHQRICKLLRLPTLRMADNPFSAPAIVSSLDAALTALPQISPEHRTLWMRKMVSLAALGFHPLYVEINRILEASGVDDLHATPRATSASEKERASEPPVPDRALAQARSSASGEPRGSLDKRDEQSSDKSLQLLASNLATLVSRLQRAAPLPALRGSVDGAAWPSLSTPSGEGSQVVAALGIGPTGALSAPVQSRIDQSLIDSLTALQAASAAFDLAEISAAPRIELRDVVPGYASGEVSVLDATTIELVSMLFEFVFERRELRDEVKGVLGRLQIPMLKAAMVDRGFFSRKTHPARLLLNRLADVGLGWSPDNAQEAPLFAKIQDVVGRICRDFVDDLGVFTAAQNDLDVFVELQELDAQPLLLSRTAEAEAADLAEAATREIRTLIEARIAEHALPDPVVQFIRDTWQAKLCTELRHYGRDSEQFTGAVNALDELIWSVQPKLLPQDRHDLGQRIPRLVRRLRAGLGDSLAPTPPTFFDQLFDVHLGLLRGAEPEYVELTDFVDDDEEDIAPTFHELVAKLVRDQWIEIEGKKSGELHYARLTWISPQRSSYLFTTRLGGKASIFRADELAANFRDGTVRLLDSEPMIDRALSGMFASSSTP